MRRTLRPHRHHHNCHRRRSGRLFGNSSSGCLPCTRGTSASGTARSGSPRPHRSPIPPLACQRTCWRHHPSRSVYYCSPFRRQPSHTSRYRSRPCHCTSGRSQALESTGARRRTSHRPGSHSQAGCTVHSGIRRYGRIQRRSAGWMACRRSRRRSQCHSPQCRPRRSRS